MLAMRWNGRAGGRLHAGAGNAKKNLPAKPTKRETKNTRTEPDLA